MSAKFGPKTVVEAKLISIALVKYVDVEGVEQVQLALVGDNTVHLLNSKALGISDAQSQGPAATWLKDGVFTLLGKP